MHETAEGPRNHDRTAMSRIAIAIGAVVAAIIIVGAIFVVYDDLSAPPIIITDSVPGGVIVVQVTGAVATPGAYEVPAGARVVDVIAAAGGTRADADLGSVNQARRVRDEDQVVIPGLVQLAPPPSTGVTADAATDDASGPAVININSASAAELDALPGVGPAIAQRIIDYRTERGPFQTVDELANVGGISAAMVDEIRAQITVSE
jgi:competence protein ComEA